MSSLIALCLFSPLAFANGPGEVAAVPMTAELIVTDELHGCVALDDSTAPPGVTPASAAKEACPTSSARNPGRVEEIPVFTIQFEVDGCPIDIDSSSCGEVVPLPNGDFAWSGECAFGDRPMVRWNTVLNPDPVVSITLLVTNPVLLTQLFTVIVVLPTVGSSPSSLIGGTVVGVLLDGNGDGATFAAPLGDSAYHAVLDGVVVETMLDAPYSTTAGPWLPATIGPQSFGGPVIPSQPGPAFNSSLGVELHFTLTPGDSVALTGTFALLP